MRLHSALRRLQRLLESAADVALVGVAVEEIAAYAGTGIGRETQRPGVLSCRLAMRAGSDRGDRCARCMLEHRSGLLSSLGMVGKPGGIVRLGGTRLERDEG